METVLADKSPALGYGVAVAVQNKIFVHGGIGARTAEISPPSNSCHIFDCDKQIWLNLTTPTSPSLSYHCAYVTSDRYVHLVGGWNGKFRSSCVHIYDVQESRWLSTCKTIGFPNGAGLSGHATVPIEGDGCLITGRLGGLLTQRKSGCVLTLRPIAFPTVYRYEVLSGTIIQSRSGHTCTPVKSAKTKSCLILGGRDRDGAELLQYDQLSFDSSTDPITITESDNRRYHRTPLNLPPSRRYHVALPVFDQNGVGDAVFVHGGEDFASTAKGPSKQGPNAVLVSTNPQNPKKSIYALDDCEKTMPRLTGHKAIKVRDKIFILGGFSDKWQANRHLYELKL